MLLKIISKHRGRSPPSPGDPVMVCVFPLPVTPYVKRRPRRDSCVVTLAVSKESCHNHALCLSWVKWTVNSKLSQPIRSHCHHQCLHLFIDSHFSYNWQYLSSSLGRVHLEAKMEGSHRVPGVLTVTEESDINQILQGPTPWYQTMPRRPSPTHQFSSVVIL